MKNKTGWVLLVVVVALLVGCGDAVTMYDRGTAGTRASTPGSRSLWAGNQGVAESSVAPLSPKLNRESYDAPKVNRDHFSEVNGGGTSTFSVDVDTASYANVRRMLLKENRLPPAGAVRVEEMVNYFDYQTPGDEEFWGLPFTSVAEVGRCPWDHSKQLARISLKTKSIKRKNMLPSNLVFLIDVSGSMDDADKLDLVKDGLKKLTRKLRKQDCVSIVVYSGAGQVVLDGAGGRERRKINRCIDRLEAGGSTNGGAGIRIAYDIARKNARSPGNNRVILCTDGDFNVGVTDRQELHELIKTASNDDISLTVLGVGGGNYNDATMEDLSNRGNGNYYYLDTEREAERVLCDKMTQAVETVAEDMKVQVFFNPALVEKWRLVGYENRQLAREDFSNDRADAGDVGAGSCVTALYELTLTPAPGGRTHELNPFKNHGQGGTSDGKEKWKPDLDTLMDVRVRYKPVGAGASNKIHTMRIENNFIAEAHLSRDFRWAAGVAWFGMMLKESPYVQKSDIFQLQQYIEQQVGRRDAEERREFLRMVQCAKSKMPGGCW